MWRWNLRMKNSINDVAWMKRSGIRGAVGVSGSAPDSIAFHPGYARWNLQKNNLPRAHRS